MYSRAYISPLVTVFSICGYIPINMCEDPIVLNVCPGKLYVESSPLGGTPTNFFALLQDIVRLESQNLPRCGVLAHAHHMTAP